MTTSMLLLLFLVLCHLCYTSSSKSCKVIIKCERVNYDDPKPLSLSVYHADKFESMATFMLKFQGEDQVDFSYKSPSKLPKLELVFDKTTLYLDLRPGHLFSDDICGESRLYTVKYDLEKMEIWADWTSTLSEY